MTQKTITPEEEAFNNIIAIIKSGRAFNKSKNDYYSEACAYALKVAIKTGLFTPIKKLLIDLRLVFLKPYFESIGLFFQYKAKEDFLKVVIDSEGLFKLHNDTNDTTLKTIPTYLDYLKNKKEEESKTKKEVDYKGRLKTLFKDKTKKEVENIFKDFLTGLK